MVYISNLPVWCKKIHILLLSSLAFPTNSQILSIKSTILGLYRISTIFNDFLHSRSFSILIYNFSSLFWFIFVVLEQILEEIHFEENINYYYNFWSHKYIRISVNCPQERWLWGWVQKFWVTIFFSLRRENTILSLCIN